MKLFFKNLIYVAYNILFLPAPLCHKYCMYTIYNFYTKGILNSMLNIFSVKSSTNISNLKNSTKLPQNEKPNTHLAGNLYVNSVRNTKHFPPANKE